MYRVNPSVMASISAYNPYVGTSLGGGMAGAGFWDGLKKFAGKANDFLKQTKIISKAAEALSTRIPQAGVIAETAKKLGYGKRRRRRTQRGGMNTSLKGTGKRRRRVGGSKRSSRKRHN